MNHFFLVWDHNYAPENGGETIIFILVIIASLIWGVANGIAKDNREVKKNASRLGVTEETYRQNRADTQRKKSARNIKPNQRERILARDGYSCNYCGSEYDLVIDHIWPVAKGGWREDSNLQVLCRSCNAKKSDNV